MASFKVGDKVTLSKAVDPKHVGHVGTIFEVYPNQRLADGTLGTVYSVRLDANGTPLGCVTEDCIVAPTSFIPVSRGVKK